MPVYDVILGRSDIAKLGIKLDFTNHTVEWMDHSIPMRSSTMRSIKERMQESINLELFVAEPIKMIAMTATEVTTAQNHLNPQEKHHLHKLFSKYLSVCNGRLGHYKKRTMNLELIPGAKPYC